MDLNQRLQNIFLIAFDVDGVLTNGRLYYTGEGESTKVFNVKDGSALKRLKDQGIEVAIITAKSGPYIKKRAQDLGIYHVFEGVSNKAACLKELQSSLSIPSSQTMYVGDDYLDLPCFSLVAVKAVPNDAVPALKALSDIVTEAKGGEGVAFELSERLLRARGVHPEEAYGFRCQPNVHVHVVVPARYGSTRLPGKVLLDIAGKSMLQHVCAIPEKDHFDSVTVATDDQRILDHCNQHGFSAVLTAKSHASGTDRIAEVARLKHFADRDIVINLQGDEPLLPAACLDLLREALIQHPEAAIATLATPIHDEHELTNPHCVKVVRSRSGRAMYFSRSHIPHGSAVHATSKSPELVALRHIGIYAYRVADLQTLANLEATPLEISERLEQLRALDHDLPIYVEVVEDAGPGGVDTEDDLNTIRRLLAEPEDHTSPLTRP